MRPDKPGCYWWEDIDGQYQTVRFYDDMCTPVCVGGYFEFEYYDPSEFEQLDDFEKWLGQAHPPKKVNRYTLETEYGSGGPTTNKEIVKRNVDESRWPGEWVRYDDVKEFLIEECDLTGAKPS